jgi:hypothetical protein
MHIIYIVYIYNIYIIFILTTKEHAQSLPKARFGCSLQCFMHILSCHRHPISQNEVAFCQPDNQKAVLRPGIQVSPLLLGIVGDERF